MIPGERFQFAGFEWVCLDPLFDFGDGVLAIMSDMYEVDGTRRFQFDEHGNADYRESSLRGMLIRTLVPRLGEDNLLPKEVDLTADNGDDSFGSVSDLVSILSMDEYRKYRKYIPKYRDYFWTSTPWFIDEDGRSLSERLVSSSGAASYYYASYSLGCVPACVFKSQIFQSTPLGVDDAAEERIASDEELHDLLFG